VVDVHAALKKVGEDVHFDTPKVSDSVKPGAGLLYFRDDRSAEDGVAYADFIFPCAGVARDSLAETVTQVVVLELFRDGLGP
jgi:hypothetical protein